MMRVSGLLLTILCLLPVTAIAETAAAGAGAAPELFGVREVIVEHARLDDAQAANTCGVTRDQVALALSKALDNSGVPATAALDARPPVLGVARISLIPQIVSHVDDSLNCISFVSLSAESRANAVIPPVGTLRGVTVVYWRQHTKVASSESTHAQVLSETLRKMALQFVQQYKLDQPPEQSTK